jgi:hypothetical protein
MTEFIGNIKPKGENQEQCCDLHRYLAPFLLIYFALPTIPRSRADSVRTAKGQFISEDFGTIAERIAAQKDHIRRNVKEAF